MKSPTMRSFLSTGLGSIPGLVRVITWIWLSGLVVVGNSMTWAVELQTRSYDDTCGVQVQQDGPRITVAWTIGSDQRAEIRFDLDTAKPLVDSVAISRSGELQTISRGLDPVVLVRVGQRDLEKRGGWTIFFDRMQQKPHRQFQAQIARTRAAVSSKAKRATLTIGGVQAGPFQGELRWTFFAGSQLILQEAVLQTEQEGVAFLYDMGLVCRDAPQAIAWQASEDNFVRRRGAQIETPETLAVRGRSVAAEFHRGSISLFALPHRYFYPLDFSDNLNNIWVGPNYASSPMPFGFGIRHDPSGDRRFVPWFNAPPGTSQELGLFWWLSDQPAQSCLEEVAQLTRRDRFEHLPEHRVFSSHYHVEHTREVLQAQEAASGPDADAATTRTPTGWDYTLPQRLLNPGFVQVFRDMGIDIVHLAEFHFGRTPGMDQAERLRHLEVLHTECQRLSDDAFLLLPGEEPNVHLGGHWISFFPNPVYWVLNRPEEKPFVSDHAELGKVYHVGSAPDVLRLLRAERGLAWTAHPRIKGSTGFPDEYRNELFFQSDRFLGAAWKAMPADLSLPRLGSRVLDLLDDMCNWGDPKYVLGEVDVFKIEPDHELYGHMNVNYLRLAEIPRFEDGWQPVLDALRDGRFFVTTGEVLIPKFAINRRQSGESVIVPNDGQVQVQLELKWTFPLAYAEIITGDGQRVRRHRVDLAETGAFGEERLTLDTRLAGQRWVRVEVWDVATNGAFTQPIWLQSDGAQTAITR